MDEEENSQNTPKEGEGAVIDDKTRVIVSTPEADKINATKRATQKRMIEAKSIKIEKKRTEIIASDALNELDLNILLSKEDNQFYMEKKASYLSSYPELQDDPFDLDDLHLMLMEQVLQRNLWKRKKKRPSVDIDKLYEASVKRHENFKKSLSVRRTDRQKQKGEKKMEMNIANLSVNFSDKGKMEEMLKRVTDNRQEERDSGLLLEGKVFE